MVELNPDLVLMCAPDLKLRLMSNKKVEIMLGNTKVMEGINTLAILHVFRQPQAFNQALKRLNGLVSSAADWMDMTSGIMQMYKQGVLVEPGAIRPTVSERWNGFDSAYTHISMLNDHQRTQAYLDAIREVVHEGDVVVEIGTGTGLLSIAAAQAGARHIYAIEVGQIAAVAQKNFENNHVADRVTLLRGLSTQLSLPERADVLVSEIIGSEPLAEGVLKYTNDAVKRFLKPEARLIPAHMRIYAQLLTLPDEERAKYFFLDDILDNWHSQYKIDFSALRDITTQRPFSVQIKPYKAQEWMALSPPTVIVDFDFGSGELYFSSISQILEAQEVGRLDAILLYPDLDLSPKVILSRASEAVDMKCSWMSPLWILPQPLEVQRGDHVKVTYHRDQGIGLEIERA